MKRLVGVFAAAVVLAGCGSDDEPSNLVEWRNGRGPETECWFEDRKEPDSGGYWTGVPGKGGVFIPPVEGERYRVTVCAKSGGRP